MPTSIVEEKKPGGQCEQEGSNLRCEWRCNPVGFEANLRYKPVRSPAQGPQRQYIYTKGNQMYINSLLNRES